jgi:hypothetical protein
MPDRAGNSCLRQRSACTAQAHPPTVSLNALPCGKWSAVGAVLLAALPHPGMAGEAGVAERRLGDAVAERHQIGASGAPWPFRMEVFGLLPGLPASHRVSGVSHGRRKMPVDASSAPFALCRGVRVPVTLAVTRAGLPRRPSPAAASGPHRGGGRVVPEIVGSVTRERYEQVVAEAEHDEKTAPCNHSPIPTSITCPGRSSITPGASAPNETTS